MTDERKKPGLTFWAAVVVAVLLAYAALLGPCCWLSSRLDYGAGLVSAIYRPVARISIRNSTPNVIQRAFKWYSEIGAAAGWNWKVDVTIHFGQAPQSEFNWARNVYQKSRLIDDPPVSLEIPPVRLPRQE